MWCMVGSNLRGTGSDLGGTVMELRAAGRGCYGYRARRSGERGGNGLWSCESVIVFVLYRVGALSGYGWVWLE